MIYPSVNLLIVALSVQIVQSDTCGRRTAFQRELVSYGIESRLGEWPWHAALLHRVDKSFLSYACGGTLVSRSYIVTAAHCIWPKSKIRPFTIKEMEVFVGITNIRELQPSLKHMKVAWIELHEDYVRSTSENDIAVLQLVGELEFTDYVKPICLWMGGDDEEAVVGKQGYVAGWGRDENSSLPDLLTQVEMPIVSRKDCRASDKNYYTTYLYDGKAFCAGYRNGSTVNFGDSGGGLYIEINGEWQLRGIVSNGKINPATRQLDTSSFIVFTDVAYFRPWIQSKMGAGSPSDQESQDFAVCGRRKEPKIQRIGFNEEIKWPWQGEVYRTEKRLCEVVIISEFFLLSPADVYRGEDVRDPLNLKAVFKNGTGHVMANHRIERVLRHENYTRGTRMNNIALLELFVKITFTRFLRPICVWSIESDVKGIEGHTGDYVRLLQTRLCYANEIVEGTFCFGHNSYIIQSDFVYIRHNGTWYLRGVIFDVVQASEVWYWITMLEVYRYKDWIQIQQHQEHKLEGKQHTLLAQNCTLEFYDGTYYETYGILISDIFKCYATLITPSLLITTGSCADHSPVESMIVSDRLKEKPVRKIHFHPNFDKHRYINNIAIIEVDAPFNNRPLCLPTFSENISKFPIFMPTGHPDYNNLNLTITNVETCTKRWRSEGIQLATDGSHICAKLEAEVIEEIETKHPFICEKQLSGMPLDYNVNGTYFIRGILDIALTNHCEHDDFSEVFIDVTFYADWIREIYSTCSSCPKTAVSDDGEEEPIEEWRNVDPRNRTGTSSYVNLL